MRSAIGSMENFTRLALLVVKRAIDSTTGYLCCGANNVSEHRDRNGDSKVTRSRSTTHEFKFVPEVVPYGDNPKLIMVRVSLALALLRATQEVHITHVTVSVRVLSFWKP